MSNEKATPEHDKTVSIIVNSEEMHVSSKEISYEELVNFAFDNNPPAGENIQIDVSYSKGEDSKPKGTLSPGESVKVKKGMVFIVAASDKS